MPDRLAGRRADGTKGRVPGRAFAVAFVHGTSMTREESIGKPGGKQFGYG
jgi:hypothetical protein